MPTSSSVLVTTAYSDQLGPVVVMVMALSGADVPDAFARMALADDDPVRAVPIVSTVAPVAMTAAYDYQLRPVVVVMMALSIADVPNASLRMAPAYDDPVVAVPVVPAVRAVTVSAADYNDPGPVIVMVMARVGAHVRAMHVPDACGPVFANVQREAAPVASHA